MADFTSDDTILSRLHTASSWDVPPVGSSSRHGAGRAKFDARPATATAPWSCFCLSRLLRGVRLKRLLLAAACAAVLTLFYLRGPSASTLTLASNPAAPKPAKAPPPVVNYNSNAANESIAQAVEQAISGADVRVVNGGVQRLSWGAVTDAPRVVPAGNVFSESATPDMVTTEVCVAFPEMVGVDAADHATRLAHIPAKIWQIYLDFSDKALSHTFLMSWLARSPSYTYSVLDAAGALAVVGKLVSIAELGQYQVPLYRATGRKVARSSLAWARDALLQYARFPRRVLRADFLRYLVLALEGGVYSDIDTHLVRAIHDWVPAAHRARVRLVVGLEADHSPPVGGTTYEVQFCQWTLASAPDHPAMWTMLERILAKTRALAAGESLAGAEKTKKKKKINYKKLTDTDVLEITGPAAWTEVVYEHLNAVAGDGVGAERITWQTLTGMEEPRLYGDTLVLPIDGFATGVPHSGASMRNTEQTLIRHQFQGKWRDDRG